MKSHFLTCALLIATLSGANLTPTFAKDKNKGREQRQDRKEHSRNRKDRHNTVVIIQQQPACQTGFPAFPIFRQPTRLEEHQQYQADRRAFSYAQGYNRPRELHAAWVEEELRTGIPKRDLLGSALNRVLPWGFPSAAQRERQSGRSPQLGPDVIWDTRHRSQTIFGVQNRLGQLGYFHGVPNGIEEASLAPAIARFERDHGLYPTGRISRRLVEELNDL